MPNVQGWECPTCHRCFAPTVLECSWCGKHGHMASRYYVPPCLCGTAGQSMCPVHPSSCAASDCTCPSDGYPCRTCVAARNRRVDAAHAQAFDV